MGDSPAIFSMSFDASRENAGSVAGSKHVIDGEVIAVATDRMKDQGEKEAAEENVSAVSVHPSSS